MENDYLILNLSEGRALVGASPKLMAYWEIDWQVTRRRSLIAHNWMIRWFLIIMEANRTLLSLAPLVNTSLFLVYQY